MDSFDKFIAPLQASLNQDIKDQLLKDLRNLFDRVNSRPAQNYQLSLASNSISIDEEKSRLQSLVHRKVETAENSIDHDYCSCKTAKPHKKIHKQNKTSKQEHFSRALPKSLKRRLQGKDVEKCRFFPFCQRKGSCRFYHPEERCHYFPKCKFGDQCWYSHEVCKYGNACTRLNCVYVHKRKEYVNIISNAITKGVYQLLKQQYP